MNNKVTMLVWNHFTNDARVLRSVGTLAEAGNQVLLIAIQPSKPQSLLPQNDINNLTVTRVKGTLPILGQLNQLKKSILAFVLASILLVIGYYSIPVVGLSLILLLFLYEKKRWLRIGYIFWQMTLVALKAPGDIVHSNDLNTLLQGVIIKKVTRTKLVYDSHEIQTSRTGYNSKWYEVVERKLLKHVDVYIHENITRANYIEQLYGRRPAVIHNYPTVTKNASKNNCNLYQLLNIPPEEPILLYQGGIQTGRGLDKLIEAVPLFNKGVLVLIGDGKMKLELVTRVKKEQLSDRIKFVEKVPLSDLPTYTKQAYLGFQVLNNVCYNHFSASSNKLFEYMMAGVPVIASRFPEMKRVVLTEKTGILVDSHSAKSIAQAVNLLIAHPEYRECLRNNALKASKRYNWEHESKQLLTVYKTIKS